MNEEKIAIDVAILPPAKISNFAIQLNRTLKVPKQKIVLNNRNCLPHITLAMGCARKKELGWVKNKIQNVLIRFPFLKLCITKTYGHKILNGEWVSWLKIELTENLMALHKALMDNLKSSLSYDATKFMFTSPAKIDSVTPKLVNRFLANSAYKNYTPHITLGLGKIKRSFPKVNFSAKCIALCQLGNYCTVQKILQTYKLSLLLMAIHCLSLLSMLWALPNYRSMIQAKKGIAVNCTLCHLSDSWELNKYGKDFSKEGRNLTAIELLDQKDSDGDGFISADEWKAFSNPGDPASTPKRPGFWLKEIKPTLVPKKILAPIFSNEASYRVQEGKLSDELIGEIEKLLKTKLSDEEKYPTLFWVEKDTKVLGVATYLVVPARNQQLNIYLLISDGRKILALHPLHVHANALKNKKFLLQFENRKSSSLGEISLPAEIKNEAEELLKKTYTALEVLERLFPRTK